MAEDLDLFAPSPLLARLNSAAESLVGGGMLTTRPIGRGVDGSAMAEACIICEDILRDVCDGLRCLHAEFFPAQITNCEKPYMCFTIGWPQDMPPDFKRAIADATHWATLIEERLGMGVDLTIFRYATTVTGFRYFKEQEC